jgi:hypothetical protein
LRDGILAEYTAGWGTVDAPTSVFVNGQTSVGFNGDPVEGYGQFFVTVDMQTTMFEVVQ